MLKEFRAFVLRGNVIDLAIGVVIGAAFKSIVDAVVNGMLNPLVGLVGTEELRRKAFCIGQGTVTIDGVTRCANRFSYGEVLNAILSFVLIAAVLFFFVVKPVNRLMTRFKPEEPKTESTRACPECLSSIPRAASRCMFCTAQVGAAP